MSSLFGKLGVETYVNGRKGKETLKRCRSQEKAGKEFKTRRLFKSADLQKSRFSIYVTILTGNDAFQWEVESKAVSLLILPVHDNEAYLCQIKITTPLPQSNYTKRLHRAYFRIEISWVQILSLRSVTLPPEILVPMARDGAMPSGQNPFLPQAS
jgi:hypothetical protein